MVSGRVSRIFSRQLYPALVRAQKLPIAVEEIELSLSTSIRDTLPTRG